jgi:hypothetical protein
VTDSVGLYSLPSLAPGTYSLSVEMTGFQSQRVDSIILDASQSARQNFHLSVGKVTEVVQVEASAEAALLQTENATDTARDTQNRYSIDGIEAMDYDAFSYNFSPSIDAIAEFRVDTSTSGTETGAAAGSNVNQIVKSGTNGLHGTLWEFNRNSALAQSDDALAHVGVTPARLNQNQFGGNVGGPCAEQSNFPTRYEPMNPRMYPCGASGLFDRVADGLSFSET